MPPAFDWFNAQRRADFANFALGVVPVTVGVVLTVWCLTAVVVGSIVMGRWLTELG